jgi:hypothetical protein
MAMFQQAKKGSTDKLDRQQHRLPMSLPLRLLLPDSGTSMTVQNQDISWGGVRFAAPKAALSAARSVMLEFPWANGDQFSAAAEVVRTESLDDKHDLVAARFSNLSASDQKRLKKLLSMLQATIDQADGGRPEPLVPVLEVLVGDVEEMRAMLAELAEGRLTITVVETYQINQSISLVLTDASDLPALQLRARVTDVEAVSTDSETAWPMFDMQLIFEHPLDELKRSAQSRMKRMSERLPSRSALDDRSSEDNPYLFH